MANTPDPRLRAWTLDQVRRDCPWNELPLVMGMLALDVKLASRDWLDLTPKSKEKQVVMEFTWADDGEEWALWTPIDLAEEEHDAGC